MKNKFNAYLITFLVILGCAIQVQAQNESDFAKFLEAGGQDASKLVQAYVEPVIKGISYGMTGGWYHTAKAHKSLGIDFGVSVNMAFVPTSENYFNPNNLGLTAVTSFTNDSNPGQGAPTVLGPKDQTTYTATFDPDGNGNQTFTFSGPEGLDMKDAVGFAAVPVPMAQIGIGIIKNTDLKFRIVPKREFGESDIQMFGVGVMHDIKQHIPGIKLLPFDLSGLIAFNTVKGSTSLVNTDDTDSRPDSQNGEVTYKFNSWTIQALISKKVSVLTGYAGVGYNIVNTNVDVTGTYIIESNSAAQFEVTNPIAIDFKNNALRFTAGIRLKFGPWYLNTDYTLQKYKVWSLGTGFAIR
jgi:hypothetical protein